MRGQKVFLSVLAGVLCFGSVVLAGPQVLEVSPRYLEFTGYDGGANPAAQAVSIWNSGHANMEWTVTPDCNWITVEPNSGASSGEVDDANVIVDINGLVEGTYNCQLTVTGSGAPNSPQIVDVNVTVYQPLIGLSKTYFEFTGYEGSSNPNDQTLSISNSGTGELNWQIGEACAWLTVEPNDGNSTGEWDDVNLSADITGLAGGTYGCQLTVSDSNASNSPQIVDVNLVVIGPVIELSATQIQFFAYEGGANPNDKALGISNVGGGTLNWEIVAGCNWLTVEPNSGSSTGEVDDVNLSVDISGLVAGIYDCNLVISDANAANSPQSVSASLYVYPYVQGALYVPMEYATIQGAVDTAVDGNIIIVAPISYTGSGNKNLDFGGKAITVRSIDPEDPCVVAATVIDCENSGRGFYFQSGEGPNSILSGFTIKGGRVSGSNAKGGGIHCIGSSPTIENCIIRDNRAVGAYPGAHAYGGGICCSGSSPIIRNCIISSNTVTGRHGFVGYGIDGEQGFGGGICCVSSSSPIIINCAIINNLAKGGQGEDPGLINEPAGDGGDGYGGGVHSDSSSQPIITNCAIGGNTASGDRGGHGYGVPDGDGGSGYGGGVYCSSTFTIDSSTVAANWVVAGTGDSPGSAICGGVYGESTVSNSIIWGNDANQIEGGTTATYSDIEGAWPGTGNIDADPCFVTGPEGDYYLSQVAAGQAVDSPCVDAGSDTAWALGMDVYTTRTDEVVDIDIVDMGYHYSAPNPADMDADGDVDFVDYEILAGKWLQVGPGVEPADIAPIGVGDAVVDSLDLGVLAHYWLWQE